jgi:hypothetical protein
VLSTPINADNAAAIFVALSEAISDSRKIKEQEVRDRRRAVSSAILG